MFVFWGMLHLKPTAQFLEICGIGSKKMDLRSELTPTPPHPPRPPPVHPTPPQYPNLTQI